MASSHSSSSLFTMLLSPSNPRLLSSSAAHTAALFTLPASFPSKFSFPTRVPARPTGRKKKFCFSVSAASRALQALIFDCDGVIIESEHLHRQAYNGAFLHFNVRCPADAAEPLNWGLQFYDELQNRIGGGKPKMRW